MSEPAAIGFIGLGVMGEPICRNMLLKSGRRFRVFDLAEGPLARMRADGAEVADSVADIAATCDLIFLSLPGGPQVEAVVAGPGGLLEHARAGQVVVDTSTAPVGLTRDLAARFAEKGVEMADAPVARTRQAAIDGTLSIMVGAEPDLFARLEPWLRHAASDVTRCGGIGCGQVVKILNKYWITEQKAGASKPFIRGFSVLTEQEKK